MALKRQFDTNSIFSMASMTDVIFLLLIFFMVTSTVVFPSALEINLPQSSERSALKPTTRIYIDKEAVIYASYKDSEPQPMDDETQLLSFLQLIQQNNPQDVIAVYADEDVKYKQLVAILDLGAKNGMKMVLATKSAPNSAKPMK